MAIIHITAENFEDEVIKSEVPVLIDFWAPWCGPCRMQGPIIDELDAECAEFAKVGKLNVDEEPTVAVKYGILSIPTIIVFENGEVKSKLVGLRTKEDLVALLKK